MAEGQANVQRKVEEEITDEDLCCIEASVVSGFEECARGEAKEKFGATVQSARGKIVWKLPISRVKEVVKMGSIDNCRVLLHSVPHFKFTNDQHESLARLQKMVPDMDWEKGLRVWRCFFDFPHPIASKPDIVPATEDLVDVVIMERKHFKDPNAKRHNKKGGRGKKKDRKKDKKNDGKGGDVVTAKQEKEDDCNENLNAIVEGTIKSQPVGENDNSDKCTVKPDNQLTEEKGCEKKGADEAFTSDGALMECHGRTQMKEKTPLQVEGRTSVFIKQPNPDRPEQTIEVKVLIPGPTEDAFPTHVDERDHRNVEPMDVDSSMNMGNEPNAASIKTPKRERNASTPGKENGLSDEKPLDGKTSNADGCVDAVQSLSRGDKENRSEEKTSTAKDFASSVIEKLKLSTPSPIKNSSTMQENANCATPPSTPVVVTTNPLTSPISLAQTQSPQAMDKSNIPDRKENSGSSVDSPALSQPFVDGVKTLPQTSLPATEEKDIPSNDIETVIPSTQGLLNDASIVPCTGDSSARTVSKLSGPVSSEEVTEEHSGSSPAEKDGGVKNAKERDPTKPTFRVTCNRVGEGHAFDSSSAAATLGSSIIRYFTWGVDLKNFDIEVLLNIDNEEVTVGIGLTKSSLHNRNLIAFGPTTLRATICYNMLRLCRIKTGDIICDPLCGTSALSIEGTLNWMNSFHFGGDYHELAMERSVKNTAALNEKREKENKGHLRIGLVQWNLNNFPLRDKCVDVFVSDLPFGHRMGSRTINRTLYPTLLSEMARTGRPGARACLLTEDRTSLIKAIQACGRFWQRRLILSINMGGLSGYVFLLTRTTTSYLVPQEADREEGASSRDHDKNQHSQNHQKGEVSSASDENTAKGEQGDLQQLSGQSSSVSEGATASKEEDGGPIDDTSNSADMKAALTSREVSDAETKKVCQVADGNAKEASKGE